MPTLTAEQLRERISYDPLTGKIQWKTDRRTGRHNNVLVIRAGDEAGYVHKSGYRYVCLDNRRYLGHRLAWLYVHGEWPSGVIDHINGDPSDNRISNLRDVTQAANVQNQRNAKGHWRSGNRWKASIQVDGVSRHIGSFETAEEARAAYVSAKRELHEGCSI